MNSQNSFAESGSSPGSSSRTSRSRSPREYDGSKPYLYSRYPVKIWRVAVRSVRRYDTTNVVSRVNGTPRVGGA